MYNCKKNSNAASVRKGEQGELFDFNAWKFSK